MIKSDGVMRVIVNSIE